MSDESGCYTCGLLRLETVDDHQHSFKDLVAAEVAERDVRPYRSRALWELVAAAKATMPDKTAADELAELGRRARKHAAWVAAFRRARESGDAIEDAVLVADRDVPPRPVSYTWDGLALVATPDGATIRVDAVTYLGKSAARCTITFDGETPLVLTVHEPPDADLDEEARGVCAAIYWSRMRSLAGVVGDYSRPVDPRTGES